MSVACLVGNGLSIAYNPELRIERITSTLLARLTEAPELIEAAQESWASSVRVLLGREPDRDLFEDLLGPLERVPSMLADLEALAELVPGLAQRGAGAALGDARKFLLDLYRLGVGHTLSIIDARAHGQGQEQRDQVHRLVRAVIELADSLGNVSFGTLNYDSLLNGAVLDVTRHECCDLADGQRERVPVLVGAGVRIVGQPLRRVDDLMTGRTRVYDLHGSISWWVTADGELAKVPLESIRQQNVLTVWREGHLRGNPAVLLTDQKKGRAQEYPFALAYAGFEKRLREADKWVIVGYSFGDEPVNEMLSRAHSASVKSILIIDKPPDRATYTETVGAYLPQEKVNWALDGVEAWLSAREAGDPEGV